MERVGECRHLFSVAVANQSNKDLLPTPRSSRILIHQSCMGEWPRRQDTNATPLYHRVGMRPIPGCLNSSRLILLPPLRNIVREWVIRVRCTKERLNREEYSADLESRRPICYDNISIHIRSCAPSFDSLLSTSRQIRPSLSILGW